MLASATCPTSLTLGELGKAAPEHGEEEADSSSPGGGGGGAAPQLLDAHTHTGEGAVAMSIPVAETAQALASLVGRVATDL